MASKFNNYSLYIPTLKKIYSEELVINIFWKIGAGTISRIDFVPIMKTIEGQEEPVEDSVYRRAFIYTKSYWSLAVTNAIDETGSYRMYPNLPFDAEPTQSTEYWLLLKNKTPVPYATTTLNVHQLAHNNGLLETKVFDMETKVIEMEQEMSKMKEEIARLKYDNDTMSMTLTEDVRRRCDSHSTTESEAENFVNSWESILRMMEEQEGIIRDDQEEYENSCEADREREEDLVYDDSGEMTQRGRRVVTTDNGTYIEYEMLDVDGYNNGDVAPRGERLTDEGETCSECGFKGELFAYGWRHADDNLCRNCANLPGMDAYEC
uniref:Uncharacterized protein n=1 Tax=viral metagenome TaxID=1070528 RepID=A0A6C0I940_9ZZZZ